MHNEFYLFSTKYQHFFTQNEFQVSFSSLVFTTSLKIEISRLFICKMNFIESTNDYLWKAAALQFHADVELHPRLEIFQFIEHLSDSLKKKKKKQFLFSD